MPTSTNVTNLKINELTEAQFDSAVSGGVIGANEISILTDVDEAIQVSTMPTAGADELGKVYQFIGTTDASYTHGYFYECVSDGQQPANYSWSNIQVQASSGGLPSQTGQSGKFLTTDGTDASWGDAVVNYGYKSGSVSNSGLWLSANYSNPGGTVGNRSIALGGGRATATHAIQIGGSYKVNGNYWTAENTVASTMKVAVESGNFEMMSADGTIPTARLTKVNTTITLAAADWSSNTQTVNVTGMTATGVVMVSPVPADQSAYTSAGIICSAQAAGTLTFTCSTTPSAAIDVNVVML